MSQAPKCKHGEEERGVFCTECHPHLLSEAASEAKPPQAVSVSASCSAASASEQGNNEADTSSRSARERGPVSRSRIAWWEPEIRHVFAWYDLWIGAYWDQKGKRLFVMLLPCIGFVFDWSGERQDALPAEAERALARNDQAKP